MTEYLRQLPEKSLQDLGYLYNRIVHESNQNPRDERFKKWAEILEDILKSIISIES